MSADTTPRAGRCLSEASSRIDASRHFDNANADIHVARPPLSNDSSRFSVHSTSSSSHKATPPGGRKAFSAFLISLVAFTIQTEAAQYVQQALGYRKPLFSLYVGHSSFILLFPLYVLFLRFTRRSVPLSHQFHLIALNLHWQLSVPTATLPRPEADSIRRRLSSLSMRNGGSIVSPEIEIDAEEFDIDSLAQARTKPPPARKSWSERRFGFSIGKLVGVFCVLTFGLTVPALSWYCAVPLTTMADITTIYNTYAIWALVFSIWFLGEQWERRKVFAVLLACGGVVLVAYGGAERRRRPREPESSIAANAATQLVDTSVEWFTRSWQNGVIENKEDAQEGHASSPSMSNAFLGDLLAFVGAVTMAAYEMAFKVVGTLPDENKQRERYSGVDGRQGTYAQVVEDGDLSNDAESATLLANHTYEDASFLRGWVNEEGTSPTTSNQDTNFQEHGRQRQAQSNTETAAIWRTTLDDDSAIRQSPSPSYQSVTPPVSRDEDGDVPKKEPSATQASEEATCRQSSREARPASFRNLNDAEHEDLQDWIPPPLPFGLQPLIMTSGIGLVTFCTLWLGVLMAHFLGWETFELPYTLKVYVYLFVVAFSGIIFNGCFSILLALWGPVLASVSCLLTTVLVFFADIALGHDFKWISLLGCVSIVAGFAVLVGSGEDNLI